MGDLNCDILPPSLNNTQALLNISKIQVKNVSFKINEDMIVAVAIAIQTIAN